MKSEGFVIDLLSQFIISLPSSVINGCFCYFGKTHKVCYYSKRGKGADMIKSSRVLLFVIINILVSAITTLVVLWVWERAHPRPDVANLGMQTGLAVTPTPQTALNDDTIAAPPILITNADIQINIRTIVGAGDLEVEFVEIINQGQNPADLTNWTLSDEEGHQFSFPALILNSEGAIKVFSKSGADTVIELYWQAEQPIWQSGETALLIDATGETIATYSIP